MPTLKELQRIIEEEEIDKQRLNAQIEWSQKREQTIRKTRYGEDVFEAYGGGILNEDDPATTVIEDCPYPDKDMGFNERRDREIMCSTGGLFGQPTKLITEGFVDKVAELLYSRWGERFPLEPYDCFYVEYRNLEKVLNNLESMGFYIPKTAKLLTEVYKTYWIIDLSKTFEQFLKKEHPELYGYWIFSKECYLLE